jgi:CheY-like chemotaxis protein
MDKKKPSVLIVDDEPIMIELVKEILLPRGYTVLEAQDGNAGLKAFKEKRPMIAILDIKMPGIHGDKLRDIIRGIDNSVRIILTSGHLDAQTSLRPGDMFLKKPFHIEGLLEALKKAEEEISGEE